jgi:iron(III) transport system ATP-binding protein
MNLMNNFFEFNCVNFFLPNKIILEKITFSIEKRGQCVCLLGPSGVGKTTILKSIAGLKLISSGEITLNKKVLSNQNTFIEPEKRNISLSFQDNALFPHLNIEENIKLGITKNKSYEKKCIFELKTPKIT